MRKKMVLGLALSALGLLASALPARAHEETPSTGLRSAALARYQEVTGKIKGLAEALPAEKYAWRPGDGVRSCSEVMMHVAGPNYLLLKPFGAVVPAELGRDFEKETDRTKILAFLAKSFAEGERVIGSLDESRLGAKYTVFGQEMNGYDLLLTVVGHVEEHLGQLIAYARMNGIKPPW